MRASDGMTLERGGTVEQAESAMRRGAISVGSSANPLAGKNKLSSSERRVTMEGEDNDDLPVGRSPASFSARRSSILMRASEGAALSDTKPSAAFFSSAMAARRSSVLMRASEGTEAS